jgi:hypothetical protein
MRIPAKDLESAWKLARELMPDYAPIYEGQDEDGNYIFYKTGVYIEEDV